MEQSWKQPPIIYNRYKMLIVYCRRNHIVILDGDFLLRSFMPCTKPSLFRMTVLERGFFII